MSPNIETDIDLVDYLIRRLNDIALRLGAITGDVGPDFECELAALGCDVANLDPCLQVLRDRIIFPPKSRRADIK